jgi:transposase
MIEKAQDGESASQQRGCHLCSRRSTGLGQSRYRFAAGGEIQAGHARPLLGEYHVSQINAVGADPQLLARRERDLTSGSDGWDLPTVDLDTAAVLRAYKYQSTLEKRHALLKSGPQVAAIFLKKNQRIESLMLVYFLAQLVCALIERQLRNAMRERGLPHIQTLPRRSTI